MEKMNLKTDGYKIDMITNYLLPFGTYTPKQHGVFYKRLIGWGWDAKKISEYSKKSIDYIKECLSL